MGAGDESRGDVRHSDFAVAIFEHDVFVLIFLLTKIDVLLVEQIVNIFVVNLQEKRRERLSFVIMALLLR